MKPVIPLLSLVLLATASGHLWSSDTAAIIDSCDACHGKNGNSSNKDFPSIAGFSEFYLDDNMRVYRDQARPCRTADYPDKSQTRKAISMCELSANLSDQTIAQLAQFYARQTFLPIKQPFDASKAELGATIHEQHCKRCHSKGGASAADDAGILAGQWMSYLRDTFDEYDKGQRLQPEKMAAKLNPLDSKSKEALLHYYASQQ